MTRKLTAAERAHIKQLYYAYKVKGFPTTGRSPNSCRKMAHAHYPDVTVRVIDGCIHGHRSGRKKRKSPADEIPALRPPAEQERYKAMRAQNAQRAGNAPQRGWVT